jgi:hypothetical protein
LSILRLTAKSQLPHCDTARRPVERVHISPFNLIDDTRSINSKRAGLVSGYMTARDADSIRASAFGELCDPSRVSFPSLISKSSLRHSDQAPV